MALSRAQSAFPESDKPVTVFVPLVVNGTRYFTSHEDALRVGMADLEAEAVAGAIRLTGKPRFTVVTIAGSGDKFLMGEQTYQR